MSRDPNKRFQHLLSPVLCLNKLSFFSQLVQNGSVEQNRDRTFMTVIVTVTFPYVRDAVRTQKAGRLGYFRGEKSHDMLLASF